MPPRRDGVRPRALRPGRPGRWSRAAGVGDPELPTVGSSGHRPPPRVVTDDRTVGARDRMVGSGDRRDGQGDPRGGGARSPVDRDPTDRDPAYTAGPRSPAARDGRDGRDGRRIGDAADAARPASDRGRPTVLEAGHNAALVIPRGEHRMSGCGRRSAADRCDGPHRQVAGSTTRDDGCRRDRPRTRRDPDPNQGTGGHRDRRGMVPGHLAGLATGATAG